MKHWRSSSPEWALMVLVSAFLFVSFFRLNDQLFSFLEHAKGVNWVFLPAGFRVLLVLVLGIPGAIGIAVGTLWLDLPQLDSDHWLSELAMGLASGFGPWCVKYWLEMRGVIARNLKDIRSASLLQFVLLYAAVNAIAHQAIFWGFALNDRKPWIDIWPMFVGDMVGALIILYGFKLALPWLRGLTQARS